MARIFLDNFSHIKAYWVMLGEKIAQVALSFGVNDLDGTVVEERIGHDAGARSPQSLSKDGIIRLIGKAGRTPVERDTLYRTLSSCPARLVSPRPSTTRMPVAVSKGSFNPTLTFPASNPPSGGFSACPPPLPLFVRPLALPRSLPYPGDPLPERTLVPSGRVATDL